MADFTRDDLLDLISTREPPCVSIYLTTEARGSNAALNGLTVKKALEEAAAGLRGHPDWSRQAPAILEVAGRLAAEPPARGYGETLASFISPGFHRSWLLPGRFVPTVVVSDTFHTKPLVKYLQARLSYHVLALTKENVTLFEGDDRELRVVHVPEMPRGLRDLEEGRPHAAEHSLSKRSTTAVSGEGGGPVFFGSTAGLDAGGDKARLRSLFRAVDKAVQHVTHAKAVPLILATFDHYYGLFREVSKNPALLEERIQGDPEALTTDQLRSRALEIMQARAARVLEMAADEYGAAVGRHRGTDELLTISRAAAGGRVRALLLEDGRHVVGKVDRKSGEIVRRRLEPRSDDVLDDVSELVIANGGRVHVLPPAMMPTDAGVAAILRY